MHERASRRNRKIAFQHVWRGGEYRKTALAIALLLAVGGALSETVLDGGGTPVPAAGTVYTTTAAGGKWSEIAWTPSTPVSGTGAKIVLAGEGAFENDLGTFSLNAITFSATASLSGDGLVFAAEGGANPTLATTGAVTNDVNVAMRLDAPLTWTGDDRYGSLRLNGPLSGTGDLIHDPTAINIIDYINGDNSAWSGNLDQRLSFIVVSNSVNLGPGTYYCTNETQRATGRNTLRIYGQNTFNNRFYFGTESNGAAARVDIFGNTTFAAPLYVAGTKLGILATVAVNGGISNWNSSASARVGAALDDHHRQRERACGRQRANLHRAPAGRERLTGDHSK